MQPVVSPLAFCLFLFLLMVAGIEAGRRTADRRRARGSDDDKSGLTTVEGAVFALFGLMIAFTFSGAASRFNEKRLLIVEEANAVEAAYMRLDMLPDDARTSLQERLRQYADSRIETYRKLPDMGAARAEIERSRKLGEEIWMGAVIATRHPDAHKDAGLLVLESVNEMIEAMNTRTMALEIHPPNVIFLLLFGLGVLCALLAGFRMSGTKHRSWVHILVFVAMTVSVVYVTLDVEYPRWGLIQLDDADRALVGVRQAMH